MPLQENRGCSSLRSQFLLENHLGAELRKPLLLWLGRISYSVYLMHIPVLYLVFRAITRLDGHIGGWKFLALALPGTLVATIALAAATYLFIELPGMRLGRRLADQRRPLGPVSLVGRA